MTDYSNTPRGPITRAELERLFAKALESMEGPIDIQPTHLKYVPADHPDASESTAGYSNAPADMYRNLSDPKSPFRKILGETLKETEESSIRRTLLVSGELFGQVVPDHEAAAGDVNPGDGRSTGQMHYPGSLLGYPVKIAPVEPGRVAFMDPESMEKYAIREDGPIEIEIIPADFSSEDRAKILRHRFNSPVIAPPRAVLHSMGGLDDAPATETATPDAKHLFLLLAVLGVLVAFACAIGS